MAAPRTIILCILALSLTVFIALFGRLPTFRNTPIGFLHRLLCIHLPNAANRLDKTLTRGRVGRASGRLGQYLLYEPHPIVLIFFLTLLTTSILAFLSATYTHLSTHHLLLALTLIPTPYIATYLAARSTTSYITPQSHAHHAKAYPYDHTLFHPALPPCRTCLLPKPARSKHCTLCGTCVARADHHCAWLNNCIGAENARWFLLLLLSLGILLPYGAYLTLLVIAPRVPNAADPAWRGRRDGVLGLAERWGSALAQDVRIGGVGMLAAACSPLVWGFGAYHVYLVWAGMTTNESGKWESLGDEMCAGRVWKGRRSVVLAEGIGWRVFDEQADGAAVGSVGNEGRDGEDEEVGKDWPITSDQIVVRTSDGRPPILPGQTRRRSLSQRRPEASVSKLDEEERQPEAEGQEDGGWERVWNLSQVVNLYDLGFWDNMMDVLFPRA